MQMQPDMFQPAIIKLVVVMLFFIAVITPLVVFFGRRRPGAGLALLVAAGLLFSVFVWGRGSRPVATHRTSRVRVEVADAAAPPAAFRLECADDLSRWRRDAVLGFAPLRPEEGGPSDDSSVASDARWIEDGSGAGRQSASVGGTDFLWWEPGETGDLVAFSGPQATEALAREEALDLARRKLAVLALLRLEREAPDLDAVAALPLALRLAAPKVVVEELLVERASRSYGELYRAALRIDAAAPLVSALEAAIQGELNRGWAAEQARLRRWFVTGASLVVFAVVLFLAYAFVNAGTKGYFAWPLRVASIAVFVLLFLAVFYLRSRLGLV